MAIKTYPRSVSAIEMTRHRRAWKIGKNTWRVYGREGKPYIVNQDARGLHCPCHAGLFDQACFHKVVVMKRIKRELERG
jgi:hypothetical protein